MKTDAERIPRYLKLAQQLRTDIRRGKLQVGDRLPSFAEVKVQHGLSQATWEKVHTVLAEEGLITREPGRGTFVASPRKIAQGVIGLYGFGFGLGGASSYWVELLEGIYHQAAKNKMHVLMLQGNLGNGWEKADGIVLADLSKPALHRIPPHMPVVSLLVTREGCSSVVADERAGMRTATEHLLQLGHRRIAYLHGTDDLAVPQRLQGYREALNAAGVAPRASWLRALSEKSDAGAQFTRVGRRDMTAWIADNGSRGWNKLGCTALLCHNDETALGALQALREAGIRVPHDVAVVGFDGLELGEHCTPRLTSVEMPLRQMAQASVEILHRQIAAGQAIANGVIEAEHQIFQTSLRERESTHAFSRSV